jgi:hypothetical protein
MKAQHLLLSSIVVFIGSLAAVGTPFWWPVIVLGVSLLTAGLLIGMRREL